MRLNRWVTKTGSYTVVAQAQPIDEQARTMLARQAVLPGVRDYHSLYALLPYPRADSLAEENAAEQLAAEDAATEDIATEDVPTGLPIWHHGSFEQARLTFSQHAIHLVRYLDDYHEPSAAALRRYRLRALAEASPEERAAACQEVADAFLEQPTRWRDVVETAVHLAAVRACEELLGQRIKGPGRTTDQLRQVQCWDQRSSWPRVPGLVPQAPHLSRSAQPRRSRLPHMKPRFRPAPPRSLRPT